MKLSATVKRDTTTEYAEWPARPFEEELRIMAAAGDTIGGSLLVLHEIPPFELTVSLETQGPPPAIWQEQIAQIAAAAVERYLMALQGYSEPEPLDYQERRRYALDPQRLNAQGLARSIMEKAKIEFSG